MSRTIILLFASLALIPCIGCGVPLMVAVVPCAQSGETVSMRERFYSRIHADGLLLVRRTMDWEPILPVTSSWTRAVEVRNGTARLPREWVPASLWVSALKCVQALPWLLPNPWTLAFLQGVVLDPIHTVPMIFSPLKPVVIPKESLDFVPLIPGYPGVFDDSPRYWPESHEIDWIVPRGRRKHQAACEWWQDLRDRIRPPSKASLPGTFRFNRASEYDRVRQFIDAELARLQGQIESDAVTMQR